MDMLNSAHGAFGVNFCLLDFICQEPATTLSFTSLVFRHNMSAVIHGWYRYTDILWAWYTKLSHF
jgi:hypothetical protein